MDMNSATFRGLLSIQNPPLAESAELVCLYIHSVYVDNGYHYLNRSGDEGGKITTDKRLEVSENLSQNENNSEYTGAVSESSFVRTENGDYARVVLKNDWRKDANSGFFIFGYTRPSWKPVQNIHVKAVKVGNTLICHNVHTCAPTCLRTFEIPLAGIDIISKEDGYNTIGHHTVDVIPDLFWERMKIVKENLEQFFLQNNSKNGDEIDTNDLSKECSPPIRSSFPRISPPGCAGNFTPDGMLIGPNHPGFGILHPSMTNSAGGRHADIPSGIRYDPLGPFGIDPDPDVMPRLGDNRISRGFGDNMFM